MNILKNRVPSSVEIINLTLLSGIPSMCLEGMYSWDGECLLDSLRGGAQDVVFLERDP